MKKLMKKSKSPKHPLYERFGNIPTEPSISDKLSPSVSFVQAKPVMELCGPDLSGTWQTPGEEVTLRRNSSSQRFEGSWGVNLLSFILEKESIVGAKLGNIDLLCGAKLNSINEIRWGNGQIWTRI